MVFSSLPFLFLIFPFFLAALLCGSFFKNAAFRNCSVLIISLFFYIWEESTNTLILIAICLINYYGASYLANEKHGKKIFIALIALNLLLLFIFKYSLWCLSLVTDRFIDKNIMLLGISFFIFHAISYLADVHTKKNPSLKKPAQFFNVLLHVSPFGGGSHCALCANQRRYSRLPSFQRTFFLRHVQVFIGTEQKNHYCELCFHTCRLHLFRHFAKSFLFYGCLDRHYRLRTANLF